MGAYCMQKLSVDERKRIRNQVLYIIVTFDFPLEEKAFQQFF